MPDDEVRGRAGTDPRHLSDGSPPQPPPGDPPVGQLLNIGPTVAERLRRVGITRRSQLAEAGALEAYRRMQAEPGLEPSLRFDLFGLEAALLGLRIGELSKARRSALARAALSLPQDRPPVDARTRHFIPARGARRRRR